MFIKNISQGARTVHIKVGQGAVETITLEPGQSRDDIDMTAAERTSAESTGWFSFSPDDAAPEAAQAEAGATDVNLLARIAGLEGELTEAQGNLVAQQDEITSLKAQLEAALAVKAPADSGETPDQSGGNDTAERLYEARDTGSGWWTIFDQDDNEVGKKIRKDDAEAFNAKSDDEKAAFVAKHTVDQD